MPNDDASLVSECRAGNDEAFRELFRRHRDDVARLIYRMGGPSVDIEDLVQEVFLQVYRSIKDFRGQARFSTWLYRVTVNVVLMHRRAGRSRPTYVEEGVGEPPRDPQALPDDQAARLQRVAAFQRLLDRLSEKKRAVFILHELEGVTPSRIAEMVGAPVLTVRTRLFYARRELARMMQDEPSLASLVVDPGGAADERRPARRSLQKEAH